MSRRVVPFAGLIAAFLLVPAFGQAPPAAAPLDPEAKSPYLWRVVLQVRPHPLLTPAFRDQLQRDIVAALQPGLGGLGAVEVIDLADVPRDRWDPLWQQFDDKGFAALDTPQDLSGVKTHFLRVEYRDGAFHLESRQHDGFTGLASPAVRRQSTRAAELVGRTAGLMLDRDFGAVGTVEPIAGKADEARLVFRGGQLGSPDRLAKVGDVFAVAQVRKTSRTATAAPVRTATGKIVAPPPGSTPPAVLTSSPRKYTLLRVAENPKDGAARCTVLSGLAAPMPAGAGVAGYRAIKLATTEAPVTVRLVSMDGTTHKAVSVVNVRATDTDFAAPAAARDNLDFRDGLFRSGRPLSNVACVSVSVGPTKTYKFPVPVLGSETVTLQFELDPKAEERATFERAVLAAASRAADARNAQTVCFEAVAKLIEARRNGEALARARGGFQAADAVDKILAEELQQLKEQVAVSPAAGNLLAAVEQQLGALRRANAELGARVKDLETVVARENDPAAAARDVQAEALNTRITLLLARGDVDEALAAYNQLTTLLPDSAEVKTRRDKLKAEWEPKDAGHVKAREYLLKTWPALATIPDVKESLPALRTNLDACKKANDRFAVRKLLTTFSGFAVRLNDLVAPLDPNTDTDRKALQDAEEIRKVMAAMEQELQEWLKKVEQG